MLDKKIPRKRIMNIGGNILFFGLLLLLFFNPNAKAWLMQRLMDVGLFKPKIEKQITNTAPEALNFTYRDAAGNNFSSDSLKGKVIFINFWATWCPPCRAEMPSLEAMYQEFKDDDNYAFIFINEDEDILKAKKYLAANNYSMPLLVKTSTFPSSLYSGTLPTTLILNKEGVLLMKHTGVGNYNAKKFMEEMKGLR